MTSTTTRSFPSVDLAAAADANRRALAAQARAARIAAQSIED